MPSTFSFSHEMDQITKMYVVIFNLTFFSLLFVNESSIFSDEMAPTDRVYDIEKNLRTEAIVIKLKGGILRE